MLRLFRCWIPKYEPVSTHCVVCMESCASRSCKCSYMHRECAREYVESFGAECTICGSRIGWPIFLEKKPADVCTPRELEKERQMKRARMAAMRSRAWAWKNLEWPLIVHILDSGDDRINVESALVHVLVIPTFRNEASQLLMNIGMMECFAKKVVDDIIWFASNYAELPRTVKKKLRHALRHRVRIDFVDEWD